MNCYTVEYGRTHIGISLTKVEDEDESLSYVLHLGKDAATSKEVSVGQAPDAASHVLVAGGIHLMRTARLIKIDGEDPAEFVFAKAKHGLRVDTMDARALVMMDVLSTHKVLTFTPDSQSPILVQGFEDAERARRCYNTRALFILEPGQHISYEHKLWNDTHTVTYDFDERRDRFPHLSSMKTSEFMRRPSMRLV